MIIESRDVFFEDIFLY